MGRKKIERVNEYSALSGVTIKQKLKNIRNKVYVEPTVGLDEYRMIVYEWLRINRSAYSVLDFYEDNGNTPFMYDIADVSVDERINKLLELRISRDASKGILRGTITNDLMKNLYGWKDKSEDKSEYNNENITFELNDQT